MTGGSRSVDVLVVGAGPGGAAAATHLARAGLRVLVVDRARFPRDKPCSEFTSPAVVPLLAELGVLSELDLVGAQPRGTTVITTGGGRLTGRFGPSSAPFHRETGLSIARRILDHALVEAARRAGAELEEQTTLRELLYEGGMVAGGVVSGPDGTLRTIRSRLVIGADGLRSIVARRIGVRRHGRPRRIAFVAHLSGVRDLGDTAELHVGAEGYVGLNDIGGGLTNVALVVPQSRAEGARGDAAGYLQHELTRYPAVAARVREAGTERKVLVTGPFAARASRVVTDGALLLGDAAEFFDPFTGEGIYRALHGAQLAAEVAVPALHESPGIVTADALAPYAARRRAAFGGQWTVEQIIGWMMLAPRLFDHAVRRIERRGLADRLIGVTGDLLPAGAVLSPGFLLRAFL